MTTQTIYYEGLLGNTLAVGDVGPKPEGSLQGHMEALRGFYCTSGSLIIDSAEAHALAVKPALFN